MTKSHPLRLPLLGHFGDILLDDGLLSLDGPLNDLRLYDFDLLDLILSREQKSELWPFKGDPTSCVHFHAVFSSNFFCCSALEKLTTHVFLLQNHANGLETPC